MSTTLIDSAGAVVLPAELRTRYHLEPATTVRIVETRHGLLLVPVTQEPMPAEFQRELAAWQSLDAVAWAAFPFENSEQ